MAIPSNRLLLRVIRVRDIADSLTALRDGSYFDGDELRMLAEELEFHAKNLVNDYENWLKEE